MDAFMSTNIIILKYQKNHMFFVKRRKWISEIKLTSSSIPFIYMESLAFALDKKSKSLSPAPCIEARINSAERMLQKQM
jgi:hypothetical protein